METKKRNLENNPKELRAVTSKLAKQTKAVSQLFTQVLTKANEAFREQDDLLTSSLPKTMEKLQALELDRLAYTRECYQTMVNAEATLAGSFGSEVSKSPE